MGEIEELEDEEEYSPVRAQESKVEQEGIEPSNSNLEEVEEEVPDNEDNTKNGLNDFSHSVPDKNDAEKNSSNSSESSESSGSSSSSSSSSSSDRSVSSDSRSMADSRNVAGSLECSVDRENAIYLHAPFYDPGMRNSEILEHTASFGEAPDLLKCMPSFAKIGFLSHNALQKTVNKVINSSI